MGFELAFVYNSVHRMSSLVSEWQRLINQHDKPGIQDLLFTVGGPDRSGFVHPADALLFDFMQSDPSADVTERLHLKRVLVHYWATGKILQMYPERRVVSPGISAGFVPAHRPLVQRS